MEDDILKDAQPLAPIMPVNAAKALKRYTRKGKGKYKIAALMKPCEIRATIELTKLNQVHLEDVTLFSYDCVGALPMQDYIADPKSGDTIIFDAGSSAISMSNTASGAIVLLFHF